jgi:hypothetical protein
MKIMDQKLLWTRCEALKSIYVSTQEKELQLLSIVLFRQYAHSMLVCVITLLHKWQHLIVYNKISQNLGWGQMGPWGLVMLLVTVWETLDKLLNSDCRRMC